MSTKNAPSEVVPENLPAVITPRTLPIKREAQPIVLADILKQMGLSGPRVPADQLVDTTFTILGAKQFASAFPGSDHAYFVVARSEATEETFTTVLGGQAVIDILDALVLAGFDQPLTVTLRWNEGGKFNGYYSLE